MRRVDVLIVGAGPTGIGAALRAQALGLDWLMVEASDAPGGMASSVADKAGYTWDLGGHVLHSHFPEFDEAVDKSGVEMRMIKRNGWAWMEGQLYRTPIQHQMERLPADLHPDAPAADLGEYYRNQFGSDLARRFFTPFQEKMWAHPVEEMDHAWTSLRNGSALRNVPDIALRDRAPSDTTAFPYPVGGTGQLWSALAELLDADRIRYGTKVVQFEPIGNVALLHDDTTVKYTFCVSSMPLPRLLTMNSRWRPLYGQADLLVANQVVIVGLGIPGAPPEGLADKTWVYCPDREVAWHRATMMSNYNPEGVPADHWSIMFEYGSSKFRPITRPQALLSALMMVAHFGVEVMPDWRFTRKLPYGYPVPVLGRDEQLRELDHMLTANNIRSRGRFGGWRYESCNSDYSFMQGHQAIDAFVSGTPEDVYWNPELYS